MRRMLTAGLAVGLTSTGLFGLAPAASAAAGDATVSVLHAIPAGAGADRVDVYAGDQLLLDNLTPGTLETLRVPGGTYDLAVFADGDSPGSGTPVLEAADTQVPAGANATVTANLTEGGDPALNVFVNDTAKTAAGEGRLTVRHVAAAPAVDVRAGAEVVFGDVTNPNENKIDLPAGTVSADVVLAGTDTVALGPADVPIKEGVNTIVYAWGSAEGDSLELAVQEVGGLHSAPRGVPAGEVGLADSSQLPVWAFTVLGLALLGATLSGARLVVARPRGR